MAEKSATLNNLPPMPDHGIIGRERELEGVITALLDPDIPIVTLLGPAGTGKTALALAVAHRLREQDEFPGGIVWLNASAVQSLDDMWKTIRRALDLPSPQAAQRHLREHPTLLILDGLNEAAQDMEMLTFLDHLPRSSRTLVTSRKRVELRDKERVFTIGALSEEDAVRLFMELASRYGTKISVRDRPIAARICQLLDGHPLAIQLVVGIYQNQNVPLDVIEQRIATGLEEYTYFVNLAAYYERQGDWLAAIKAYRQVLVLFDSSMLTGDDHRRYAEISHRLGVCLRLDGQWGQAVEQQEETFRQFKKLHDFHGQGRAYLETARAYQAMNSYDLAVLYYNDAYRLFKRAGDVALAATVREEMGNLKYYLRILKPAMTDWEEAARLYEQAGRPGKVAIIRQNLAQVQSS